MILSAKRVRMHTAICMREFLSAQNLALVWGELAGSWKFFARLFSRTPFNVKHRNPQSTVEIRPNCRSESYHQTC